MPGIFLSNALLFGFVFLQAARADGEKTVFGSREVSESGLIGIIYDLKQNQKREATGVNSAQYATIIEEFLRKDWDEAVFNRYFRAARPLYTTQIFIPVMDANAAPKAFGMEEIIKPSCWVVHYKGQVSPPEDGTYRFICYADDMIAVAVNGKTVGQGSRSDTNLHDVWIRPESKIAGKAGNGELIYGNWVELKKDEPVDLDVIVGERPGGQFCAFLMYEKQGTSYPTERGQTTYPIFQLGAYETPKYSERDAPPFFRDTKYWIGHQ